jgi:hypothetical protein
MRCRFINGLPLEIVETLMKTRSISAEHLSLAEILDQAKQVETTNDYITRYRQIRVGIQPTQIGKPAVPVFNHPLPGRYNAAQALNSKRFVPRTNPVGNTFQRQNTMPVTQNVPPRVGNTAPIAAGKSAAVGNNAYFACGKTGHYANNPICPMYGKTRPKARLNMAQVVDDQSDDDVDQEKEEDDRSETQKVNVDHNGEDLEYDQPLEGEQYSPEDYTGLKQYKDNYQEEDQIHLRSARVYAMSVIEEEEKESRPFRSAMSKAEGIGSRPPRDDNVQRCLAAMVEINGISAYALFDSESSADVMSPDFARVSKMRLFKLDRPVC